MRENTNKIIFFLFPTFFFPAMEWQRMSENHFYIDLGYI